MTDLIDRQAAIDLLRKRLIETANNNVGFTCDAEQVFEDASERIRYWIDELPSAQPDACENTCEIERKSNDLISRQDAIRWVKTECNPYGKPTLDFESGKKVIEHLKQMQSAQPEIIRCRECKWYDMSDPSGTVEPINYRCRKVNRLWREPDDHCKGAEKKDPNTHER